MNGRYGNHMSCLAVLHQSVTRRKIAQHLDIVPMFKMAYVVDGHVVMLAPEKRRLGITLAATQHIDGGDLPLALGDHPVLHARIAAAGEEVGETGDITRRVKRLADTQANLIGLKDGTGDFETLQILKRDFSDRLALINGVPTAEMTARQCFAIGIRTYSSAVFSFLPGLATAFFRSVRDNDFAGSERLMNEFYLPLVQLRRRRAGYAVSIIKAGLRAVGKPAGSVRPPLVDLTSAEEDELKALIAATRGLVGKETAR